MERKCTLKNKNKMAKTESNTKDKNKTKKQLQKITKGDYEIDKRII